MKQWLILAVTFLFNTVNGQSNSPDFSDKYEYRTEEGYFRTVEFTGQRERRAYEQYNILPTGGNAALSSQFNSLLSGLGKEGWELVTVLEYKLEKENLGKFHINYSEFDYSTLSYVAVLKRIIYHTKTEIEKQVAYYSKQYSDSLRTDLMDAINKNTWSQMGKYYKQEIVDEIIKRVNALIEESAKKIIDKLTPKQD